MLKKLMTLILIVVFSISSLLYSSSFFVEKASDEISSTIVEKQIERQIYHVVDEINSVIPIVDDYQVVQLINKVENNPKISETIDRYGKTFMSDLINEETKGVETLNHEVHELLYVYTDDFSALVGSDINYPYIDGIIEGVIERIDFTDYYNSLIHKVDGKLSNNEMKVLKFINYYFEHLEMMKSTTLLLMISSFIFALLLNLSILGGLWVLIFQSLFSLLAHLFAHYLSIAVLNRYLSSYTFNLDYQVFIKVEIFFLIVFIVSFILRSVSKNVSKD